MCLGVRVPPAQVIVIDEKGTWKTPSVQKGLPRAGGWVGERAEEEGGMGSKDWVGSGRGRQGEEGGSDEGTGEKQRDCAGRGGLARRLGEPPTRLSTKPTTCVTATRSRGEKLDLPPLKPAAQVVWSTPSSWWKRAFRMTYSRRYLRRRPNGSSSDSRSNVDVA